jgi:uncharacterized protein
MDHLFATVKAVATEDGPGEFEAILSTKALDRDGEVVDPHAFDPLPASIPIYFEHNWKSGAAPVGRGVPVVVGDEIHLKAVYASTDKGQEMRALVTEGIVDSMSVGFLNGKRESKSGVRTVVSGEMFEGSLSAIPINTGAKVLVSKSGARTGKAIVGSVEALQDRVRDALEDAYGEYCCWLRGVLPDRVIFERNGDTFSQTYTDDGDVVTLTGAATEVDVHEVVTPDADAATEPDETKSLPDHTVEAAGTPAVEAVTDPMQAKAIAAIRLRELA